MADIFDTLVLSIQGREGTHPLTNSFWATWAHPLTAPIGCAEPISSGTWQMCLSENVPLRPEQWCWKHRIIYNLSCIAWLGIIQKSFKGYPLHLELNRNSVWLPANPCMSCSGLSFRPHLLTPSPLAPQGDPWLPASSSEVFQAPGTWLPLWNAAPPPAPCMSASLPSPESRFISLSEEVISGHLLNICFLIFTRVPFYVPPHTV